MDKEKYYKYMLLAAALYNWVNSTIFIIASLAMPDIFPMFGVVVPISNVWLHLALVFIFIFGIGYFMVSINLKENHGLIVIGAMAKVSFFLITLIYMVLEDVGILVVLLGGIDILFVCLFIEFLFKYE